MSRVIIATNHSIFSNVYNWEKIKVIIDGRNCLSREQVPSDIYYAAIGRGIDGIGKYNGRKRQAPYPGIERRISKILSITGQPSVNSSVHSTSVIQANEIQ